MLEVSEEQAALAQLVDQVVGLGQQFVLAQDEQRIAGADQSVFFELSEFDLAADRDGNGGQF